LAGFAAFASKRERPRRPCGVEFAPQFKFMGEAFKAGEQRALSGGQDNQHGAAAAVTVCAPSSVKCAVAILPQELEAVFSLSVERKR